MYIMYEHVCAHTEELLLPCLCVELRLWMSPVSQKTTPVLPWGLKCHSHGS